MLRVIRGESLDAIGARLGFKKSTLSTAERFGDSAAGPKLRRALEREFGLTWSTLSAPITGDVVSAAIVKSLFATKKEP
jgi:hypothetical protein